MALPDDMRRSPVARAVGTLVLSGVSTTNPMGAVRAAAWSNIMARFGVRVPLFIVHDLGLLFSQTRGAGGYTLGARRELLGRVLKSDVDRALVRDYGALMASIADSEVPDKAASFRLRDDLIAVILVKLLGDVMARFPGPRAVVQDPELPLDPALYENADLARHYLDFDQTATLRLLKHLGGFALHLTTMVEQIDLDTLRLLGIFKDASAEGGQLDLADLHAALTSPEANDVVNFSLELLPSVLETKRASGAQTFAVDGYASVERRGNLDSLVLTELAYDDELFTQKVIDNELYYYGHEKSREEERRLQLVLIDASASMRGERQVFARGLALALVKKLALQGDEVSIRFFDSRLYDPVKVAANGSFPVPYLLSFKSERGRNYGRVFRHLLIELGRLKQTKRRRVVVTFITHGQCHIPVELVRDLRRFAQLYGVFILPSREVELDYLGELDTYQVVTAESLADKHQRRGRAIEIVEDAGARGRAAPAQQTVPPAARKAP